MASAQPTSYATPEEIDMSAQANRFLSEYSDALLDGNGAVFVGAGVSMAAGYPSWASLLREIGEELGVGIKDVHDLAALAQWSIQHNGGATRIRNTIRTEIAVDHPIPESLETIARLPIRHIWTTNYDRLIERAFEAIARPLDAISSPGDLALRARPGATRLYKMHGSITNIDEIVISTDDYELFRSRRGAFLPLLQAHLTGMSMLFVGLSFTDPNVRHVLSLIRESFTDAPPEHFAIVRPPQLGDYPNREEFEARLAQHKLWAKDLRRYGLTAIEVETYEEIPQLMRAVERRVAMHRVWISGSWPIQAGGDHAANLHSLAETLGNIVGDSGLSLVTGTGLLVGSASISGFLSALRNTGAWDLERRLIARPFPQPLPGHSASRQQWAALRSELARQAGTVIFIGGAKEGPNGLEPADGVLEEFRLAKNAGAFLLPIGATGGAARIISNDLLGSNLPSTGGNAARPTDEELVRLADAQASLNEIGELAAQILRRASRANA